MADINEISAVSDVVNRHGHRTIEIVNADGQHQKIDVANMTHDDEELAARFGYKPVFKREFGYLSTFSFAVSISGVFATIMTTMSYPLAAGGSSAVVFCWLVSGAGCMCIAVSFCSVVQRYTGWR